MLDQANDRLLPPQGGAIASLEAYLGAGGGAGYGRAQRLGPAGVIEEIRRAGLRGRGGAGFPTAVKWSGVRNDPAATKYVVGNGAEGEPGTFKDRVLLRANPYQVIEGLAIAKLALGAAGAYLCTKRLFERETAALQHALAEIQAGTAWGDGIELVLGPDEYLFGEEKAQLEVIEGGLPLPRVFPPRMHGLFTGAFGGPSDTLNHPTVVDNVETLAHVAQILRHDAGWFRAYGSADSPGTMLCTVSGQVQHPQVVEVPLGLPLRHLLFDIAGGPPAGHDLKAVMPGAGAVLTPDQWDTPLTFDALQAAGSGLGSGGFVAYDDTACMVQVLYTFSRFLYVESCDQCPPCKTGSQWITERLEHLLAGTAQQHDMDEMAAASTWVTNAARCFLASEEAIVTRNMLAAFPDDFAAHLHNSCALRHDLIVPKMIDYQPGAGFTYDQTYLRKQPDWTYSV